MIWTSSSDSRRPSATNPYSTSIGLDHSATASLPYQSTKTPHPSSSEYDPSTSSPSASGSTTRSNLSTSSAPPGTSGNAAPTNSTPAALTTIQHAHHSGLSAGALAAAIVVPILAVLLIGLLIFLCLRRRATASRQRADSNGSSSFLPVWREKWGSLRSSNSSKHEASPMEETGQAPMVMGIQNNAYYTGLDTSSHGGSSQRGDEGSGSSAHRRTSEGGTTFVVPPPPYHVNPGSHSSAMPVLPQLFEPTGMDFDVSQFAASFPTPPPTAYGRAPVSPVSPLEGPVHSFNFGLDSSHRLAAFLDPPQSSARSARSFTSTLYSDDASVHSARAARRSVGPSIIAQPSSLSSSLDSGHGHLSVRDPFDDPNTPVTPLSSRSSERRQLG